MLAKLLRSQGEQMSGFCPQWVYSACIGLVIKDFIEKDIPLDLLGRKYGKELSEKYDEINPIQVASIAEDIVRILESHNSLTGLIIDGSFFAGLFNSVEISKNFNFGGFMLFKNSTALLFRLK